MKYACRIWVFVLLAGFVVACGQDKAKQIDIFYTADAQGFFYSRPEPRLENRDAGGYGVLKSFLDKQHTPFLLFDGGNWFGSSPQSAMTQGAYMTQLLQQIPYTAASVSSQDFIFGWPALRGVVRELPFPFIVSNLKLDNQIPWPMHDYQIFTVEGIKIGVFGLINPQAMYVHKSRLAGFSAQDPLQSAREMAARLRDKGVDFIVVLSSLGETDAHTPGDSAIAAEVDGIDLILSANKNLENAETDLINGVRLVYPGAKLDSVAHIKLFFDKNKQLKNFSFEDIPLLKDNFGEDEALAAKADALVQSARQKMNIRLTQTKQEIPSLLGQESSLGNLLTECLHRWAKLDGAVLNADSIRSNLPAGVVSEYDLYQTYPYGDNITFLTIKGGAFIRALEASLEVKDNFPQIAGFRVSYRPGAPQGKRIVQVVLDNGRIVREKDTYRFAVTDHILAGGFGHDFFINSLEFKNTFVEARQIMRACLRRQKELAPPPLGRWKKIK